MTTPWLTDFDHSKKTCSGNLILDKLQLAILIHKAYKNIMINDLSTMSTHTKNFLKVLCILSTGFVLNAYCSIPSLFSAPQWTIGIFEATTKEEAELSTTISEHALSSTHWHGVDTSYKAFVSHHKNLVLNFGGRFGKIDKTAHNYRDVSVIRSAMDSYQPLVPSAYVVDADAKISYNMQYPWLDEKTTLLPFLGVSVLREQMLFDTAHTVTRFTTDQGTLLSQLHGATVSSIDIANSRL